MTSLLTGTIMLSLLHGLIPSHWLPVLALKEKFGWQGSKTVRIACLAALTHSLSTFLLGVILGLFSLALAEELSSYTRWVIPSLLVLIGSYFIIQHHRHHHFHIAEKQKLEKAGATQVVTLLVFMMFLSPCLEIEAYFLMAGTYGWMMILTVGVLYTIVSVLGITFWVYLAQKGLHRFNWHRLEHNAGLVAGGILVLTGIISFFTH
jgi:putative Mn2+ efflux pump MntP